MKLVYTGKTKNVYAPEKTVCSIPVKTPSVLPLKAWAM